MGQQETDETGTPRRVPGVRPRLEPGMAVEISVRGMNLQMRKFLQEHELGLEVLIEQELKRRIRRVAGLCQTPKVKMSGRR